MPTEPDDERLMTLLEAALAKPPGERESYLREACANDRKLFELAWEYIRWDERMQDFLLEPVAGPGGAPALFAPGELLDGRFRIAREVARGGMGIVYEATDEKLGRRIAVKCALPGFTTRLTPEALHAGEVSHINVCRTFEIHAAATPHGPVEFLTMEFVDGETLTARLKRGVPEAEEAREIAHGIASGLAEAHRHRVIHGDLKTNNVILGRTPEGRTRPVITDFGLARGQAPSIPIGGNEKPNANAPGLSGLAGTPGYMAPELWQGAKPSPASDVYALGVILYEIATGRRPYAAAGNDLPHTGKLPPAHSKWDRILARCLDRDPARRYRDAGEVADALEPSRAWRWWLAAAAAVLMAAISGIVTWSRAAAPRESIVLAMAPLTADAGTSELSATLSRDISAALERMRGSASARLTVIPAADTSRRRSATHLVQGTLTGEGGEIVLHTMLTDSRTQANNADMVFRYAPAEIRYAPTAVAGMVTAALHLPPPLSPPIKEAARQDYLSGLALGRVNSTVGRALPLLERAIREDPDSAFTWSGLAQAQWTEFFVTRDSVWLRRSEESLRQAKRRDPDIALVHLVAGRLAANAGFYEPAEIEYLRSIELDPGNADAHRRLGQVYELNGRLDQARAEYLEAVKVEPGYFTACQDLGAFYQDRGDLNAAARQFERCVKLAPQEPDAHRVLGYLYKDLGRYADAERESRAAVGLAATPDSLAELSMVLLVQARDREAIPYLLRAVRLSPTRSLLWMDLGNAYRKSNLPADAARAWQRGLTAAEQESAHDPRDGVVASRLAFLCARLGDRRRAEAEIDRAVQLSPDSNDTRETAIWTYEVLGKREEALNILMASLDPVFNFVRQWPDLADLRKDSRFQTLMDLHKPR